MACSTSAHSGDCSVARCRGRRAPLQPAQPVRGLRPAWVIRPGPGGPTGAGGPAHPGTPAVLGDPAASPTVAAAATGLTPAEKLKDCEARLDATQGAWRTCVTDRPCLHRRGATGRARPFLTGTPPIGRTAGCWPTSTRCTRKSTPSPRWRTGLVLLCSSNCVDCNGAA